MALAVRGEAHEVAEQHGDLLEAPGRHAVARLELGDRRGRQDRVQQAVGAGALALDLLHLPLDPRQIRHLLIAPALLLQAGADARLQEHRVERLGQVVVGAELDAAHHAVDVVERRDHDHRNVAQPGIVLEAAQHREAVHLGHHDVEQDQVDRFAGQPVEGVPAMDRGHRLVLEQLQLLRQHVAIERLVVDDQDAGGRHRCAPRVDPTSLLEAEARFRSRRHCRAARDHGPGCRACPRSRPRLPSCPGPRHGCPAERRRGLTERPRAAQVSEGLPGGETLTQSQPFAR